MRFGTIRHEGSRRVAVFEEDGLVPLPFDDLVTLIEGGLDALDAARRTVRSGNRIPADGPQVMAPIQRFRRDILCTGWNYWDHFEEGFGKREGQDVDRPDRPTFFTKGPDTVIGPYDDVAFDSSISSKWDYEAEMAVVFGKPGRSIPRDRALEHVWGYSLANDISHRDLQRAHGGQWLKGKSIDKTMPLGPVVVTSDEIDPADVRIECRLNGEVMQSATTAQMAFDIPTLISELSWGMTVRPGDVLLTGTPSGIGNAREPEIFLGEGDQIVTSGSGIGELRNTLVETVLSEYEQSP